MLQVESGKHETTLHNFNILQAQHGKLIGLVHRLFPDKTQSGIMFFRDGLAHEYMGLASGMGEPAFALSEVVSNLCGGFLYLDVVAMIGSKHDETAKRCAGENKTVYYCLAPVGLNEDYAEDSVGLDTYQKYIKRIYIEDLGERVDFDEAIT